jgi:hypothetical protein
MDDRVVRGSSAPNDDLRKGVFRIEERNIPEVVFLVKRGAVGVLGVWEGWDSWVRGGANRVSLQAT